MALTSITIDANVAIKGRALARNGTVTMISDLINRPTCATAATATPAPSSSRSNRAPTGTPQLPNTATPEGTEPVSSSPVFAIIGAVAGAVLLRGVVARSVGGGTAVTVPPRSSAGAVRSARATLDGQCRCASLGSAVGADLAQPARSSCLTGSE